MRTIFILLTRSTTIVSRFVYMLTRDEYTHASIAFDPQLFKIYSSTRKNGRTIFPAGPCREDLCAGYWAKHQDAPCALFSLEIPDEVYFSALATATYITGNNVTFHFNILGLLFCWLSVRSYRPNHFFCSQLVAELLENSGALIIPKHPSLMRPMDFIDIPELSCLYRGTVRELLRQARSEN